MISGILIVAGIVIGCLGVWWIRLGMDPLGYSPPFTYGALSIGMILLMAGLALRLIP